LLADGEINILLDGLGRKACVGEVDGLQRAAEREELFPHVGNCEVFRQRLLVAVTGEIKMHKVLSAAATQWLKQLLKTQ